MAQSLAYASASTLQPRATKHSELAVASWILFIAGVALIVTLICLAHRGSYTYPFERFERNVGPRRVFVQVLWWNALVGALLALAALLQPFRRRWIAWLVLMCHIVMMCEYGWRNRSEIWLLGVVSLAVGVAIVRFVAYKRPRGV